MRKNRSRQCIEILLVEDNPGDIRLTLEAFEEAETPNHLTVARDGVEALGCLRREGKFENAPRPDLILLDLNLPLKDGREVLREIKADPGLKSIPVIVLTTSDAGQDILNAYDLHANSYQVKPVDIHDFFALVRSIDQYWLSRVKYPSRKSQEVITTP